MEKFFEAVFRFGQKLPPVAREINSLGERFARQVRRARLKARGITPPDELSEGGGKRTIHHAIKESPYQPRKTIRAVEAMQGFLENTTDDALPGGKSEFFEEVASADQTAGTADQIWNRVDGYCRNHDIDVPDSPKGYREILNEDGFKN